LCGAWVACQALQTSGKHVAHLYAKKDTHTLCSSSSCVAGTQWHAQPPLHMWPRMQPVVWARMFYLPMTVPVSQMTAIRMLPICIMQQRHTALRPNNCVYLLHSQANAHRLQLMSHHLGLLGKPTAVDPWDNQLLHCKILGAPQHYCFEQWHRQPSPPPRAERGIPYLPSVLLTATGSLPKGRYTHWMPSTPPPATAGGANASIFIMPKAP
jgi:hypothetical protein